MIKSTWLVAGAMLVAITIVGLRSDELAKGYAFQSNMAAAAASTVAALLAITLFVERGMAVVNAILFGDRQRDAELKLLTANEAGASLLSDVMAAKERVRLFGAFVAGLFVSSAGVRTLENLLDTQAMGAPDNGLLYTVDVVLTAALIAGGGNGLSFLMQLGKDRLAPPAPIVGAGSASGDGTNGLAPAVLDPNFRARLTTTG